MNQTLMFCYHCFEQQFSLFIINLIYIILEILQMKNQYFPIFNNLKQSKPPFIVQYIPSRTQKSMLNLVPISLLENNLNKVQQTNNKSISTTKPINSNTKQSKNSGNVVAMLKNIQQKQKGFKIKILQLQQISPKIVQVNQQKNKLEKQKKIITSKSMKNQVSLFNYTRDEKILQKYQNQINIRTPKHKKRQQFAKNQRQTEKQIIQVNWKQIQNQLIFQGSALKNFEFGNPIIESKNQSRKQKSIKRIKKMVENEQKNIEGVYQNQQSSLQFSRNTNSKTKNRINVQTQNQKKTEQYEAKIILCNNSEQKVIIANEGKDKRKRNFELSFSYSAIEKEHPQILKALFEAYI